ncbi:MAG TPA: S1/P1 nuclease [Paucimonas sp.]|nr:S1/P1 nuclease [Paucimonas sp.]
MRSRWLAAALAAVGLVLSAQAFAWGENGHQTVGAIANLLLQGSKAEAKVKSILGTAGGQQLTLQTVSVWADCVRGIHPNEGFAYDPGKYRVQACAIFEDAAGKAAMKDYAQRNHSNCLYAGKNAECHKSFHFADIDVEHDSYASKYVGAHDYDIVHAINAALRVLQGKPCPAPFNIAGKREALMLLAHFVGDLHQPLHVGAIYLDPQDGAVVNPDAGAFDPATDTAGGNVIVGTGGNLHSQWDKTKFALNDPDAMNSLVTQAKRVGTTNGDYMLWAESWAGDTIVVAQQAFQNVEFSARGDNGWPVSYHDRRSYLQTMRNIQKQQVIKGGARLAQLLKTLWPD